MEGTLQTLHESLTPCVDSTLVQPPPRILLAEDSDILRQTYTRLLTRQGYQVHAVPDGAAAWECLQAESFDLLITDQSMPGRTGLQLVSLLREINQELPVLLVSGSIPAEELLQHPELHFSSVLCKPFPTGELLRAVAEALQRARYATHWGGRSDAVVERR